MRLKYLYTDLCWSGDDARVALVSNFDSLTWEDALSVEGTPQAASHIDVLEAALRATATSAYSGQISRPPLDPGGGVDSVPFGNAGMPTININTQGDLATAALWHTPEDTPDRVPWSRIDDAIALSAEFLDRVCAGSFVA
jgi:Zn-dependent M28 family amino/carboxypeptidase